MEVANVHPVYLIKGSDPSLVSQEVSGLVRELVGDRDLELTVADIPETETLGAILDAALTPAFLSDRRVVIARDIGRFRADQIEPLAAYIDNPIDSTVLVLVSGGGAITQRITKAVKAKGHIVDVAVPSGKARQAWFKERVDQSGLKFDRSALALLSDHIGEEPARLAGICDALMAAYGEGASIGEQELSAFLTKGGSATPWQLTDAIDSGDAQGALNALAAMLGPGQRHPLAVLATLIKHVTNLSALDGARVSGEAEAAKLLGISPFPAKKALTQSRRMGTRRIQKAIELVSAAELDLKGASAWTGEMVLEVLVGRLAKLGPSSGGR